MVKLIDIIADKLRQKYQGTRIPSAGESLALAIDPNTGIITTSDSTQVDNSVSGAITTQNLVPAGVATNNSAIEIDTTGKSVLAIQVTGTYTGALSVQVMLEGTTTWVTLGGTAAIRYLSTGLSAATIATGTQGIFVVDVSGATKARLTALAAVTGTANAVLRATTADSQVALTASLPAGAAVIGAVTGSGNFATTVAAAATNIAKAEDAVAAAGDTGVFFLAVRRDVPTISASAAGDYNEVAAGPHGQLYTQNIDAIKRTYAAAVKFTPVAGTAFEISGAASTTVEINRITITVNGSAAGKLDFTVTKRSAVATGGTAVASTKVPYNAADAASLATVRHFTVAPTAGAAVGAVRYGMIANGVNVPSDRLKIESGVYSKSITLSAAAQALTIELAGTPPTGAEVTIDIEWTEY